MYYYILVSIDLIRFVMSLQTKLSILYDFPYCGYDVRVILRGHHTDQMTDL